MQARVLENGDASDPFQVSNGVKQGYVLALTLFSILFAAMLLDAFRDCDRGVFIQFATDGKLFNLRRLQAKTKLFEATLLDFLFAVGCTLSRKHSVHHGLLRSYPWTIRADDQLWKD